MQPAMDPEDFLKEINTELRRQNQTLATGPERLIAWAEGVRFGAVLVGPCAFLFGENDPSRFFARFIPEIPKPTHPVLVLSQCCRQYDDKLQAQIRALAPNIEFVFPAEVPNLFGDLRMKSHALSLKGWLIEAKLVVETDEVPAVAVGI